MFIVDKDRCGAKIHAELALMPVYLKMGPPRFLLLPTVSKLVMKHVFSHGEGLSWFKFSSFARLTTLFQPTAVQYCTMALLIFDVLASDQS